MQRDTAQRRAIRDVFRREARPLSPEEVLKGGQASVPSLGIATVYRSIKGLIEEGWLKTVDLPGDRTRYELSATPHHHHFVCTRCGQASDIEDCPSDVESLATEGYQVEAHELTLYGACPACV
jgi:Fur family transcriptional regulator, ferric uptake regulator